MYSSPSGPTSFVPHFGWEGSAYGPSKEIVLSLERVKSVLPPQQVNWEFHSA